MSTASRASPPAGEVIRVPAGSFTFNGFRAWALSDSFPRTNRVSYINREIFIEVEAREQLIQVPTSARTWNGFREWATSDSFPEVGRITFVNGEIWIDMSPEEIETHIKVKSCISRTVEGLVEENELGEFLADGALVTNGAAQLAAEPDGTFMTWSSLETERVRVVPREGRHGEYMEVQGAPDWVLEVISVSSRQKDTKVLRQKYHKAGIPEYWLVDALGDELDFRILVRRKSKYVEAQNVGGWTVSPVFGKSFRLTRKRNRLGRWRYKLEFKA